ncbi:fluoride efflux transporter CrcB [Flavobacterium amniphilum]|uniref:fluoride efflux transporter CrcB n=1 Tax=Flavobacterium amniphilum TaxID=1834035 RepID=UPI00202A2B1B|nr:fluoride efflux transporter CrcB [Flavobacterium amniphilum]MCL9807278.1 fluoride efflux transporter CrcB [Flavobacterium amniphilum]
MKTIIYIGIGGGIGSVLRYLTNLIAGKFFNSAFPMGTFLVNCIGCLLIGLFFGYFEKNNLLSKDLKLFLITGLCGGYTTFSAFSVENVGLIQNHQTGTALLYTALSIIIGFTATWCGILIAAKL